MFGGRKRQREDDVGGGGGGGGWGMGDGGGDDDDDPNDSDYRPSRSPSPGQAFRNARQQQPPPPPPPPPPRPPGGGNPPKRARGSSPSPGRREAKSAAAQEKREAKAAAAEARREAKAASAEATEEARSVEAQNRLEFMRESLKIRAGQVFSDDVPVTDVHGYQAWMYDPKADHATFAAKTQHSATTSASLGLTVNLPIDSFCEAWHQHHARVEESSFEGLQSNGKYCWACEHCAAPEFAKQPNKHLTEINDMIVRGRKRDPRLTAVLIQGYYIRFIARKTKKVWELEMILLHITDHEGDNVYLIKDTFLTNRHTVKRLARKGVARDPASITAWAKLVTLDLKLLLAKIRIERDALR